MKRRPLIFISLMAIVFVISACTRPTNVKMNGNSVLANIPIEVNLNTDSMTVNSSEAVNEFTGPISDALSRITKKTFGIYITPKNSPVQPERFTGYHTGVDFETTSAEAGSEVEVTAGCDGIVRVRQWVSGYGGVLVQDCILGNQTVTVLYGHLNIDSINVVVGKTLRQGDYIGNLGQGGTHQTDGERKHLHLGIHKGTSINYKGYVSSQEQLNDWVDAEKYLK